MEIFCQATEPHTEKYVEVLFQNSWSYFSLFLIILLLNNLPVSETRNRNISAPLSLPFDIIFLAVVSVHSSVNHFTATVQPQLLLLIQVETWFKVSHGSPKEGERV